MNQKQFDLFQSAIQWVFDEQRASDRHTKHSPIWHRQGLWGMGTVTDQVITAKSIQLDKEEKQTYQRSYQVMCTSAACVAGNIVLINGDQMVAVANPEVSPGLIAYAEYCIDDQRTVHSIGDRAQRLTGISPAEAGALFGGGLSRPDVISVATRIATHHGYQLELV